MRLASLVVLALVVTATSACGSSRAFHPPALTFTCDGDNKTASCVADADGSHTREIAMNAFNSTLSPDGSWLTFERTRTNYFNSLFLVDLRTERTRSLGETPDAPTANERWSPVGDRFAVSHRRGFFLVDATSGKQTKLLAKRVTSFDFTPDGSSIVLAIGKGVEGVTERSDLFLLRLSDRKLERLTHDRHSKSPLVSRTGIAYVRFKNAFAAPEVWLMHRDGSGRRLIARCCEIRHYGLVSDFGFELVGLSEDGKHLLACRAFEGGCDPVAIDLANGRRYAFPELRKLGSAKPTEFTEALGLTRDGRTALVVRSPWDDEPGPTLLYSVPFTGGKPKLLARNVAFARWRG